MGIEFMALLAGCPSPHDTGRQQDGSLDTSVYDTGIDDSGESAGDTSVNTEDSGGQNSAPVIETTTLPVALTQTAYSAQIAAIDIDGDSVSYALTTTPSWLSIDSLGVLSGTPTKRGVENVEVLVSDGLFDVVQQYNLVIDPIATVEMKVIDGGDGSSADSSCSIDVILTNKSDYSETVTAVDGIAAFSLDEIGTYDISVPSTNTGSTCYGGVSQSEWVDVAAGVNSSWVTLIPEWEQNYVVEVVGGQLDMGTKGFASGNVNSVTDLFLYMTDVWSFAPDSYGWESGIREGTANLEVDTIDFEYNGIEYNDALELAISYWDGHLAPSIQQVNSSGEIWFTRSSNWQTDVNYSESGGIWTISDVEVEYTTTGSTGTIYTIASSFAHEMGHSYFNHTNVNVFIMNQSPAVDEPHELEKLIARILTNIGNEAPSGDPINLYSGYYE